MIVFSSVLNQVFLAIPDNTETAVYCRTFYIDQEGTVFSEPPHEKVQIYGDIVIEANKRYVLKNVYAAYQTTAQIIQCLSARLNGKDIFIDLDRFIPELRMLGEFETE